jgi:hypothetical protein
VDRETYQRLSLRTQATFASRRGVVYDLFQAYVKRKRELRTYDVADRCENKDIRYFIVLISLTGLILFYEQFNLAASLDPVLNSCPY